MATVRPFRLWVPPAEHAAEIACVPYDVIDTREARQLAEGLPRSFLHVIRPEIDLPPGTDEHADAVYDQARNALQRWLRDMPYTAEPDRMFVYRLRWRGRDQCGFAAVCSIDEYDDGTIAVHERTRKDKEDDRARHVLTMRCQAEPIFLAYRATRRLDEILAHTQEGTARFDFEGVDGVRHTLWDVADPVVVSLAFEDVQRLYIADGHHRAKSASRAREALRSANPDHVGTEGYNFVLSVVFPDSALRILPYNRVVTDLGGRDPRAVLAAIGARFPLRPASGGEPGSRHTVHLFDGTAWSAFDLPGCPGDAVADLDVSLLQDEVLAPILGIVDPRTDRRIEFVGGIRGTDQLERRVSETGGLAFSMYPTSLSELFEVADGGGIMPPKSTWFEPKLRSGLFVHTL